MKIFRLLIYLLTLVSCSNLFAQSDADLVEAEEVIQRYDVEVVIFKNIKAPKGREYILPVSSPQKDEKIFDLSSAGSLARGLELSYEMIPVDELRLIETVTNIVQSPRYELLVHAGWRQPGLEREEVLPIWIKGGRIYGNEFTSIDSEIEYLENNPELDDTEIIEFDDQSLETLEALELQQREEISLRQHGGLYELEGKITIALSRYLHTYAELVLRRPRLSMDQLSDSSRRDKYAAEYLADTRILNNHSLKEHRRMRSKNLHYLDNPEFAMLILITPYNVPEEVEEIFDL